MPITWNLWHGCHKISPGCANCYVYRMDEMYERDSSIVVKTKDFDLPLRRNRKKEYKIPQGEMVYTCFSSDFLVEDADNWRPQAWEMMRIRSDLDFMFITKRIDRLEQCLPEDWGKGYPNVSVFCTVENQKMADYRLPIFLDAPICHKGIVCEPLLEEINLEKYLTSDILGLIAGGESGHKARVCRYDWILSLRGQCVHKKIPFHFKQTGAKFYKDGKLYYIKRKFQHQQARKANIDVNWEKNYNKKSEKPP